MQRILNKLIPISSNEKPGKLRLLCDVGNAALAVGPLPVKKNQEDELCRQKNNDEIIMFDIFGALNY